MYYENILNPKPNETVSQGIITEAPPLVCGQSVPLLLNSFTNTSNRYSWCCKSCCPREPSLTHPNIQESAQEKGRIIPSRTIFPSRSQCSPVSFCQHKEEGREKSKRASLSKNSAQSIHDTIILHFLKVRADLEGYSSNLWSSLRPLHSSRTGNSRDQAPLPSMCMHR